MSGQIISIRLIVLAAPFLVWGVGIAAPETSARADDCITAPNSAGPKGSHWYYKTDRQKRRKCWFLRPPGQLTLHTVAYASPEMAPTKSAGSVETSATASAGAPISNSAGNNAPSLPPPNTQAAPTGSAPTHESVQQRIQEESVATSTQEAPAPQASASSQTGAKAPTTGPSAALVWPDPPAVATVEAQKPNLVPSDEPADSFPPAVDAQVSHDSEGTTRGDASSTTVAGIATFPAVSLAKILLVMAVGLTAAGFLYTSMIKFSTVRGRRLIIDHSHSKWIDDRQAHEPRDDGLQPEFANEQDQSIGDLHPSLVPATSGYGARRPLRADHEYRYNTSRKGAASHITDNVSERENKLAKMIREIDQLLQSSKGA